MYAGQACSGTVVGIPTVFVTILDDGACSLSGDPNCSFSPNFVSVPQGGSVVWTISGALQHDVKSNNTANAGLPSFSGNITAGGMVRVTLDVPGVYQYYDLNYNWMKGTILVNPVSPLPPPTPTSSQVDLSGSIAWNVEGLSSSQAILNVSHQISVSVPTPIPGFSFTPVTESGSFEQSINLSTRVESPGTAASIVKSFLTLLLPVLSGSFTSTTVTSPLFQTMLSGQSDSPEYTMWWVNGPLSGGSPVQILHGWSSVTGSESLSLGGSIGTRSAWIVTSQLSQTINVNIPDPNNPFNPATSTVAANLKFLWSYDKSADLLLRNNETISLTMHTVNPTTFFTATGQVPITITRDIALTINLALLLSSTNLKLPRSPSQTSTLMGLLFALPWMPLGIAGLAAGVAAALIIWFSRRVKGTALSGPAQTVAPPPAAPS